VIGWNNAYGVTPPIPRLRDAQESPFGRDGSYLALRQLRQHVARFWQWCDVAAAEHGRDAERLAAKMVGRWLDGSPLALCPASLNTALSAANEFRYAEVDRRGDGCPIGAHVRRTNPRDSLSADREDALRDVNTHRILRRGRPYGLPPADPRVDGGVERGLVFACLNANPERQFEFVQQIWANNESFGKLHAERDPILGTQPEGGGQFSIPGAPLRTRLTGIPEFVNTVGGAYFFLPSRSGLAQLAGLQ
jgi:Dyp-type peroxidase family